MRRLLLFGLAGLGLLVALAAIGIGVAFPPSRMLALAEAQAGDALGTPVRIGDVHWTVFGAGGLRPTLSLRTIATPALSPPITVGHLEVRPSVRALLRGRFDVAEATIEGVELPQTAIDALLAARRKASARRPAGTDATAGPGEASALPVVERIVLRDVAWQRADGLRAVLQATGTLQADHLAFEPLTITIAGGTVAGQARLGWDGAPAAPTAVRLDATLRTEGVEVGQLAPKAPLRGRVEATTTVEAKAAAWSGLEAALATRSSFTIRQAVIEGIDLARAVTTAGTQRGGRTPLDTLRGQVATQGLPPAMTVRLTALEARSGLLSASGDVGVSAQRALDGRILVDVAGGLAGVPLVLGGTTTAPSVSLSRATMLGAAVGTAIAPGVGTAAGARLGDSVSKGLGRLFGGR